MCVCVCVFVFVRLFFFSLFSRVCVSVFDASGYDNVGSVAGHVCVCVCVCLFVCVGVQSEWV